MHSLLEKSAARLAPLALAAGLGLATIAGAHADPFANYNQGQESFGNMPPAADAAPAYRYRAVPQA